EPGAALLGLARPRAAAPARGRGGWPDRAKGPGNDHAQAAVGAWAAAGRGRAVLIFRALRAGRAGERSERPAPPLLNGTRRTLALSRARRRGLRWRAKRAASAATL